MSESNTGRGRRIAPSARPSKRRRARLGTCLILALGAIAVVPQAASAALFGPATNFPTALEPFSVTSADFNADTNPDLAVANNGSNSVSVLLGDGSGGFGPKTDFPTGAAPMPVTSGELVTSADFNGDNKPDLATANFDADTVSVLLGDGSGGFGAKSDFTTGSGGAISVTSADFDADGNPDLATANLSSDTVSVLLGDGSGGFGAKTDFPTGRAPYSVTSADFDGDNNPDLAVADRNSNSVSVRLGDGSGGFGPKTDFPLPTTSSRPESVTSADFNGDGNPDLAVANRGSTNVSVLLGDGSGGFGAKTNFTASTGPRSVTSADFNADGRPDLAVANGGRDTVSVLRGDGSGGFGPTTDFPTGIRSFPSSVTSADFNADGRPDLATANRDSDSVSVLLNTVTPKTKITKKPKAKIKTKKKSVKVKVRFTSEPGATFRCRLDKSRFKPCASPYKVKAKSKRGKGKKHKISIKAIDAAGNVGKPAVVKFKVIRKR